MVTDTQGLLVFLLFVSGAVTEFVEQIKKQLIVTVFKGAVDLSPEQQSLLAAILLVTRFVAGVVGILMLGGYSTLTALLPFFAKLPEIGTLLLAGLLIGLGSDAIHMLLDFVKSLGNRLDNTATIVVSEPAQSNRAFKS